LTLIAIFSRSHSGYESSGDFGEVINTSKGTRFVAGTVREISTRDYHCKWDLHLNLDLL
jgi:hypothetical protein